MVDQLTDKQQRILELAYEEGLYDVPRESTAAEIAKEVGVTEQSVSEMLRRATKSLVEPYFGDSKCPQCRNEGEFKHEDNNIDSDVYFCTTDNCGVVLYQ